MQQFKQDTEILKQAHNLSNISAVGEHTGHLVFRHLS